jgi:diguanylate cyclase (GGDEF)-like protein
MRGSIPQPRVLIVDGINVDRELARDAIAELAEVECVTGGRSCLERLDDRPADLVLSELHLDDMSGLELLREMAHSHPHTDVVLISAFTSPEAAFEAMRAGAVDYLPKPVRPDELRHLVTRLLERRDLRAENDHLRTLLSTMDDCRSLAAAVEPAEIHGIALEVLLRRLGRSRGIAVFRGNLSVESEDLVVCGFSDTETERLRGAFGGPKRPAVDDLGDAQILGGGELLELLAEAGVREKRCLLVPMDAPNQGESGFVLLPEDRRPFESEDLEIARMVASYGQVGVYNAERYLRAKERAFVDDVTGAYNARYLFAALEHELRRADRYDSTLSVVFIDIDRFKLVNDQHGHLVGSRTLRALAEVLGACIRQVDTLARYGGDEFTILLAETDHDTASTVAERIRAAVARTNFEAQAGKTIQITVSVGIATFPAHGETAEGLVDSADKAMYRAKSLGRNRISSAADLAEN